MAVTQNTYTGNGSTVLYSFTFPYLETTDIKVSVNGTITTAYTLANATTIQFNTAPANGAAIRIYRQTDDSALSAQFYPGSAIRSQDLNDNFTQNLYVTQEVNSYAWDNEDDTVKSTQTWVSSDSKVATTAALDARFQDEFGETLTSSETWVSNDDLLPTTASVDQRIDTAITNDIGTDGTGITVTNDGDGTITLGLADNSIDFSKIKNDDIITYAEQEAGSPSWSSDTRLATTYAAAQRFDTIVSPTQPTGSNWVVGKTWLQNDQDLTVSVWNGSNWLAVASGGAFINQPKVVYVDATAGDDNNDGHRISRPKKTIKAAVQQINADATYGDGSVVVVAPGVYAEVAPIDITRKDVSIIGTALRSCVVHPTSATETNSLFRVNSGSFLQNLTFTGVKASGARGGVGSVDPNSTYGLPITQGWNVSFYPGAMIYKSPYIQSCTNFSDSEINNTTLNPHTPAGGAAGDTDSNVTGGGLLIDGSTVSSSSPLRSMVCDSYTHVGLDGPGILVTNNGYCQATSSYAFFNHYHIKCLNGGQANLAASTTDFGRYGLVADGRSTSAIFTATTTANASNNAITFTIGTPVAGGSWHGSATRPQSNMLVDIGGNTYPILSSTPNGTGWDVTISRPDPSDKAINLGLNGAVSIGATVSFYLRSMIASSGHTMEYVGSGTNYSALPENGGVPNESNQIVELNDGKVWAVTTDHNGKFKLGNFFTVDQQTNSISVATGSFQVDLSTLEVNNSGFAVLGANLDLSGNTISDTTGSVTINDVVSLSGNKITDLADPTLAQDAATKNYVDSNTVASTGDVMTGALGITSGSAAAPSLYISGDTNTGLASPGADELALVTGGTARLTIDASGNVAVPGGLTKGGNNVVTVGDTGTVTSTMLADGTIVNADVNASAAIAGTKISPDFGSQNVTTTGTATAAALIPSGSSVPTNGVYLPSANNVAISTNGTGRLFVGSTGSARLLGASSGQEILHIDNTAAYPATSAIRYTVASNSNWADVNHYAQSHRWYANGNTNEAARIDSSGRLLVGTSSALGLAQVEVNGSLASYYFANDAFSGGFVFTKSRGSAPGTYASVQNNDELGYITFYGTDTTTVRQAGFIMCAVDGTPSGTSVPGRITFNTTKAGDTWATERMRITNDGSVTINFPGLTSSSFLVKGRDSGATQFSVYSTNTNSEYGIVVRNDGLFYTGVAPLAPYNNTTALAANVFVDLNGILYRSTSSARFKTDIETVQDSYADNILNCRPVWYRSTANADDPTWGWWGFIAEEVAEVDPRLVFWKTHEAGTDENGMPTATPLDEPIAEGVQYDRFVPLLLNLVKRQKDQIEALEARLSALESV